MGLDYGFDGLDFQNNQIIDNDIRNIMTNRFAFVKDSDGSLLRCFEATFMELKDQSILIDFFQKAIAKGIVNLVEGINDFPGQVLMFVATHFLESFLQEICVNLLFLRYLRSIWVLIMSQT